MDSSSAARMDVYDSIRPLAIISRIFGIFPVANTRARPYTRKWIFSFTAPLLYVVYNIFWHLVLKNTFFNADISSIIDTLDYVNINLTVIIIYIVVQVNFQRICNLMSKLHDFDQNMAGSETVNRKMRKISMISLGVFFIIILAALFLHVLNFRVGWHWEIFTGLILITSLSTYLVLAQAVFFSESIRLRFSLLNHRIRDTVSTLTVAFSAPNIPIRKFPQARLYSLSTSFDDLVDVVSSVNTCYSLCLATLYLHFLMDVVSTGAVHLNNSNEQLPVVLYSIAVESANALLLILATCIMDGLLQEVRYIITGQSRKF